MLYTLFNTRNPRHLDVPFPEVSIPSNFVIITSLIFLSSTIHMCMCVLATQSCSTRCNPMDCTCQAPLSMEFSRQEYWSGLPFPSPGDLPNPGIKPRSPALQADTLRSKPKRKPIYVWLMIIVQFYQILIGES